MEGVTSKMNRHRVLFVCHGNVCRSPMAEVIFRDMVKKRGWADLFDISSRATSTEEIWNGVGNPVYPPARAELARHGLGCDGIRAKHLTLEDYEQYDLLIGMDARNINNMLRMTGNDPENKIRKLLDYTARDGDVADPWYTGQFDVAYRDIWNGCAGLLEALRQEELKRDSTDL